MAPPPDPPTSITLRVKVPPGHVPGGADEFSLGADIPVASKIGQIRERIQGAIPSSPTPERQRLLYGGRALVDNDQTVADALNIARDPTQTEYVIHLLVKSDGASTAPVPHRTGMRTPARSESPAAAGRPAIVPPAPVPQQVQNAPRNPNPQVPWPSEVQQQVQNAPQNPNPQVPWPSQVQQQHMQQHVQQHQAALLAQTQRLHAQMHQNQHGFAPPMMPFQMQQLAGQMPGMAFQQPYGFPLQQYMGQGQQHPMFAHGAQIPPTNPFQRVNPGQAQDGQATNQPNNGQTTVQLPTRSGTHQTANGQDVQVRIHQTVRIPNATLQAQQRRFGSPAPPTQTQNSATPPQQHNAQRPVSALDRARQNVEEMQRMLSEMRSSGATTEATRAQIQALEERTRSFSNYIDPFRLHNAGDAQARSSSPTTGETPSGAQHIRLPSISPLPSQMNWQQQAHRIRQAQHQPPNANTTDTVCYLLSSPTGPNAILYSPQHGMFTGQMPLSGSSSAPAGSQPTHTTTQAASNATAGNAQDQQNQPGAQPQGEVGQQLQAQAQGQAAQPDPLGPLGPILGHLWLLLRVLIFSYFLLGANMGWRRPLALFAIGMGFWMIRMGLLGDGGALRRWWDGIMNDGRAPPAQQGQQGQDQQQGEQQGQPPAGNARPGQMPTPEQLAQRLLDEDARNRDQARDQRVQWVRERIRPLERAVALLVASLWPGVGEAFVRAREEEERRRAEEEIAARRREEEERQKKEEEEKQKIEESQSDEKANGPADAETSAAAAGNDAPLEAATESEEASSAS